MSQEEDSEAEIKAAK